MSTAVISRETEATSPDWNDETQPHQRTNPPNAWWWARGGELVHDLGVVAVVPDR